MIGLIIVVIGLLLLWVLFRSGWDKQRKIVFAVAAIVLFGLGVWFEQRGETPLFGLVKPEQIEVCGLEVMHSYRSNFDVRLCLKNTVEDVTVKRINLQIIAERCEAQSCEVIDTAIKDLPVNLLPLQQVHLSESLRFDHIEPAAKDIRWRTELKQIKGIR